VRAAVGTAAGAAPEPALGAIALRGVGKKYKRYRSPGRRLGEWLAAGRWRGHAEHWALRDVTLDVAPGEAVGVVGPNGAGKSTLLKLLVGTTQVSEGELAVGGHVAALLELGMGFHPEFSGRQNVLMALQLTGFSPEQSQALLPRAADFAELGAQLEQPLRTYSSGMQMRLGFAVATAVRPDVLIVDEALAVGDAYFQHKCIARIREFKAQGTTMLFVSHDPVAVKTLCDRAYLLDAGRVVKTGSAEAVLDFYNALVAQREKQASIEQRATSEGRVATRSGDRRAQLLEPELRDAAGRRVATFACGETAELRCRVRFAEPLAEWVVGFMLRDRLGNEVFGTNTQLLGVALPPGERGRQVQVRFRVGLNLGYGQYVVTLAVHGPGGHLDANHDWIDNAASFQVLPESSRRFAGVASLPASAEVVAEPPAGG
jgi:lipopolysaccharide transport system ATP-binding protein